MNMCNWSPDVGETVRVRWVLYHGRKARCVRDITGVVAGKRFEPGHAVYRLTDGREFDLLPRVVGGDVTGAEAELIRGGL